MQYINAYSVFLFTSCVSKLNIGTLSHNSQTLFLYIAYVQPLILHLPRLLWLHAFADLLSGGIVNIFDPMNQNFGLFQHITSICNNDWNLDVFATSRFYISLHFVSCVKNNVFSPMCN